MCRAGSQTGEYAGQGKRKAKANGMAGEGGRVGDEGKEKKNRKKRIQSMV